MTGATTEHSGTMKLRRFRPYPVYKESAVEWLGHIPNAWEAVRLKRLFSVVNGATPRSEAPEYWDGDIPWVTPEDLGQLHSVQICETRRRITDEGYRSCGTTLVPKGSLVLSTRAPIGHLAIASVSLCTNQGCRTLVFRKIGNDRYFFYEFLAARSELESFGSGSTFKELAKDKLEEIFIVVPPRDEQDVIAAFLDRETSKIDALVATKERLIDLLQEKRAALITRAVTKGLDPNALMKDSGIEWLGEIPAHWEISELRRLNRIGTSITYGIVQAGPDTEDGVPYIRTSDMAGEELPKTGYLRTTREIDASYKRSKVVTGDVVVAIRATLGKALMVPDYLDGANLTQGTAKIAPGNRLNGEFLLAALQSRPSQQRFEALSKGATFREITLDMLRRLPIAVPPLAEQAMIVDFMKVERAKVDELVSRVREAIDHLKELRTSLISAAVTGKIDVGEEAA
jgi:type I restriction enzyme S subunit